MEIKLLLLACLLSAAAQGERVIKQRFTTRSGVTTNEALLTRNARVELAPEDEDIFRINNRRRLDLADGDIQRKRKDSKSSITDESMRWTSYTIPVEYSPVLPLLARAGIDEARLEYEMRTCMSYPDRTNEKDYLYFEPLSGCWSYVGMQGGQQTISIGSGCEKRATIQHEMLHALGVYHQQSRTDRDDYVKIMTENIEDDHLHNFVTYDYETVDERRVPYDYNSVMHYSDTSFTMNGEKTIVTFDPAFQDVIGQRRTFSEGDVDMISRMYPCADPLRISYTCGFEVDNHCGYVQETDDDGEFVRTTSGQQGAPATDNTYGVKGEGNFMMYNATGSKANQLTVMRSMRLKSRADTQCLEFSYYMDLNAASSSKVRVFLAQIDTTTGQVTSTKLLTELKGDHDSYWNLERFTFQTEASVYKILFEVESGGYSDDMIALDDIQIQDKPCETSYFKVQDFSKLLQETTVGDSIYGPLLYDDEGYAFQMMFYPHGRSIDEEGYMSMFFMVARGINDDALQWPFYDRVIKMSMVDQGPEKLTSMNQFSQFITTSDREAYWSKPDSERNGGIGYTKFMSLSDIQNTRNFVKNDAIIISVNVRNMQGQGGKRQSGFRSAASTFSTSDDADDMPGHHGHPDKNDKDDVVATPAPTTADHDDDDDNHDGYVTIGGAVGLAIACTFVTLAIMLVVVLSINDTHKKAIRTLSRAVSGSKSGDERTYNNLSYANAKI